MANRLTPAVEVEDFAYLLIRYEGGAIGSVQASSAFLGKGVNEIRFVGDKGQVALAGDKLSVWLAEPFEDLAANQWHERPGAALPKTAPLVARWAESVLTGQPSPISGEQARPALEIVRAAYRSGGLPVDLPLSDDSELIVRVRRETR